jgi:hypothetical protein
MKLNRDDTIISPWHGTYQVYAVIHAYEKKKFVVNTRIFATFYYTEYGSTWQLDTPLTRLLFLREEK